MKRLPILLLLAASCGGFETVVFEAPPVAAQACDPQLVGNWLSVGDDPEDRGEVELRIASDCALLFVEHQEDGSRREGDSATVHTGRDGRIAYAWVNARWAEKRMKASGSSRLDKAGGFIPDFPETDIVVYRYDVSARRLALRAADPKQFAHRIIDGRFAGEVTRNQAADLRVRVSAPVDPTKFRDGKLFPRGDMRFVRATAQ